MLPHTPPAAARPRRILLVDDEVNQLVILRSGLAKLPNCEVTIATGGGQALNLFAQQVFDVLITDYHMPKMDGLTLATAVHHQYPSTQIIMLTAFGDEILGSQPAEELVRVVLEKPIDIKYIRSAVLRVLDQASVPDDAESNPGSRC
jgi:CheY-like chemotaxis protein